MAQICVNHNKLPSAKQVRGKKKKSLTASSNTLELRKTFVDETQQSYCEVYSGDDELCFSQNLVLDIHNRRVHFHLYLFYQNAVKGRENWEMRRKKITG